MRLYRREPTKVDYHPAKFGSHKHSDNGDVKVLLCHITSQDQVLKSSCDFTGRRLSRQETILPSLVAIGTVVMEI